MLAVSILTLLLGLAVAARLTDGDTPNPRMESLAGALIIGGLGLLGAGLPIFR